MKNIVITGANRGIGLEFAKIYSEKNMVYAICRKPSKELESLNNVHIISGVDVGDFDSIQGAVSKCPDKIDILINNAGILKRVGFDDIGNSLDEINEQFKINSLAPLLVTFAARNKLTAGSKIALITSRMGSIGDNDSGSNYGYRMSKSALNSAGKSLAIDLRDQGISVAILHPGWVKTEMTAKTGLIEPNEAAQALVSRIDELNLENSGSFWHSNSEILEW